MLEFKTRLVAPALLLLAGVALSGCEASKDGPEFPPPAPEGAAVAKFDPAAGVFPYPNDLFFGRPSATVPLIDGTLDIPAALSWHATMITPLNTLDGWSTSGFMDTSFSRPINAASLNGNTVRLVELYMSDATGGPATTVGPTDIPASAPCLTTVPVTCPIRRVLTYGTDYVAEVSDDVDSAGKILRITPLKPLDPSTGPVVTGGQSIRTGYLVILTNGIQDADGVATTADATYASIKTLVGGPGCAAAPAEAQDLCKLIAGHLALANAVGTSPDSVTLTWQVTTQSVDDTFQILAAIVPGQPITVIPTGLTTAQANPALPGWANIYVGSTQLPYYLTAATSTHDPNVMTKFWTAAGPSPVAAVNPYFDPASRNLTRFNPVPLKTSDVSVPVLVTVPNATAAGGACAKPAAGWPVAIVQHGIGGNRSQALAMADSFAAACIVVAAIDLPLHGITVAYDPDPTNPDPLSKFSCAGATPNPICLGAKERHFDTDILNNTTLASGPDGLIDPTTILFLNISSPLTGRDNLRQSEADLTVFTKSLALLDLDGNASTKDVDETRISYVGLSLGAIIGGAHVHFSNDTRTATLAVPGGVISRLLLDSDSFGPLIRKLVGGSLTDNSYLFNNYFRNFQTVLDSGDPINHIYAAQMMHPVHLLKVVDDTVVPNSATDRLIVAGGLTKLSSGTTAVGPGTGAYTTFLPPAYHGSLFDPSASPDATLEMQRQTVGFAASAPLPGGPYVTITNTAVVEQ